MEANIFVWGRNSIVKHYFNNVILLVLLPAIWHRRSWSPSVPDQIAEQVSKFELATA
jgi:hypothetical protein